MSVTTYQELLECVFQSAQVRRSALVSHIAIYGLLTSSQKRELQDIVNEFKAVAPGRMPAMLALVPISHSVSAKAPPRWD